MTFETSIKKQYQLNMVGVDNLSNLVQNTGAVYQFLKKHRLHKFAANEKIFIVQDTTPSELFLDHLQKASSLIDVENFYIAFINNKFNPAIDSAGFPQYTVHDRIQWLVVEENIIDINNLNLCPQPWMHTMVDILGNYRPCCVYRESFFNTKTHSIQEFFDSKELKDIRQEFLAGGKPTGCNHCWDLESKGVESHRQRNLTFFQDQFYSKYLDDPQISTMDLRLGNICNFNCRICGPRESSRIASQLIKTDSSVRDLISRGKWFDDDPKFVEQFYDFLPRIKNLDFYGGEPWLLKKLPKLLQYAIDSGDSQHIRLHFNTNGSVYTDSLFKMFSQFASVDIAISIDDTGDRFELQRGGKWTLVQQNIAKIMSHRTSTLTSYIMPTVNIQNVLYLENLYSWTQKLGYDVQLNFLENPDFLSIDNMTVAARDAVCEKYQNHTIPELSKIENRVKSSPGVSGDKFQKHHQQVDALRNESFRNTHKTIANLMGIV